MTGHGQAVVDGPAVRAQIELRSVNNRFLKTIIHSDLDPRHEGDLEALIRTRIQRGTVTVRLRLVFHSGNQDYRINTDLLKAYQTQLTNWNPAYGAVSLDTLLTLPGVVEESADDDRLEHAWPTVYEAAKQALEKLVEMRRHEGEAMSRDLLANCDVIASEVEEIRKLAPQVVESYQRRITERINSMLESHGAQVQPADLIREVGVFAERVDISEELVRLDSHLEQFRKIVASPDSTGRKLEFLTQELLRETNTIGSKANDADIAAHVVEIKSLIERVREMVQNIE